MIRGFSSQTGYNCSDCQFKCCSTEYDLPLFPNERDTLHQNHPSVSFFIQSKNTGDRLIRGDCCPFLTSRGLCILHDSHDKPLICQTFPLIFWKINPELTLCWIYPCRGNGFQWIASSNHQISDQKLNDLLSKAQNRFKSYWGDQIDGENPYSGVSHERIQQEIEFFENNKEVDLITRIADSINLDSHSNILHPLISDSNQLRHQEDLKNTINAVIHWLCWSPIGLQINFSTSKLLFYIAAQLITSHGISLLNQRHNPFIRERILQQLGSFLASAVMPSFWTHIEQKTQIDPIRKFSAQVREVLSGEISQQEISKP